MNELYMLVTGMGVIFGAIFAGVGYLLWKMVDMGRSWVVMVPTIPGAQAQILRKRLNKQEFNQKVKGSDEKERMICSPKGAFPTKRGPLHLVAEATGWNLVAPSKEDKPAEVTDTEYQAMRVVDPKIYWRATQENDMEDFYAAQQNKDPWQKAAIVPALIAICVLAGVLGLVLWKSGILGHLGG